MFFFGEICHFLSGHETCNAKLDMDGFQLLFHANTLLHIDSFIVRYIHVYTL